MDEEFTKYPATLQDRQKSCGNCGCFAHPKGNCRALYERGGKGGIVIGCFCTRNAPAKIRFKFRLDEIDFEQEEFPEDEIGKAIVKAEDKINSVVFRNRLLNW